MDHQRFKGENCKQGRVEQGVEAKWRHFPLHPKI